VRDEVLAGFLEEIELEDRAALLVTHQLELAARLADRVAVLSEGRVVLCADTEDVLGEDRGELPRRLKDLLAELAGEGSTVR
jgi:ABC-type glutathione transport system ATPase component